MIDKTSGQNELMRRYSIYMILVLVATIVALSFFAYKGGVKEVLESDAQFPAGQNAIDIIGQYNWDNYPTLTPDYTLSATNGGANRFGGASPQAVEIDTVNHRLFIADNANRILVYNLNESNQTLDRVADYILGQASYNAVTGLSASASTTRNVNAMAFDPTTNYLYVLSTTYNRVTVFDVSTITNNEDAIYVLGQADFSGSAAATTQSGLNSPFGLAIDVANKRLFVSQTTANRVSVFDINTITNGEPAINVIGQLNFTTATAATTQIGLNGPISIEYDSVTGYLYVAQSGAHRVTIFDVNAITDGEPAINVLGQTTFTNGGSAVTQSGFSGPRGLAISPNNRLYVMQSTSNRISVFDISTLSDGEPAINVLGQTTFTSSSFATSQSRLRTPIDGYLNTSNSYLYVPDNANRRTMIFDVSAITDGEDAIDLYGQTDGSNFLDPQPIYTKATLYDAPNSFTLSTPSDVEIDYVNHKLFVADTGNARVLVYNLDTTNRLQDKIADAVLGKPNMVSTASQCEPFSLTSALALELDSENQYLYVSDANSLRIVIYDISVVETNESAIHVLGQPDMQTCEIGQPTNSVNSVTEMEYDYDRNYLYAADQGYHRVLVFDLTTITDGESPINVLGQSDLTSTGPNGLSTGLYVPTGLAYDPTTKYLYVASALSQNIKVFDLNIITNGEAAINVLGQPDFTTINTGIVSANYIGMSSGLAIDPQRRYLYATDVGYGRILAYDINEINDGEAAVSVIGQPDFTSSSAATTQSSFTYPYNLTLDTQNQIIYVSDIDSERILLFDVTHNDFIVTQSDSTTTVVEGGANDTITIKLSRAPTTDVVIDLVLDNTEDVAIDKTALTFTSGNWDTPQTVTFSTTADDDMASIPATLTLAVNDASSDDGYDEVADQVINIVVDDTSVAGTTITVTDNQTGEDGTTASFNIVLTSQPTADVTIPFSTSNTAESTVQSNIVITAANWNNPTSNTISVNGVNDTEVPRIDGNTEYIIVTGDVTSSDPNFDALTAESIQDITLQNVDNDSASIIVTTDTLTTSEEALSTIVKFSLKTKPEDGKEVSIPIEISKPNEAVVDKSAIIITSDNWNLPDANTATITGLDDDFADGNVAYQLITGDPLSNDANYDLLTNTDIADIDLLNEDNDEALIKVNPSSLTLKEGNEGSIEVSLTAKPTVTTSVILALDNIDGIEVQPTNLEFTTDNWETAQSIKVISQKDTDKDNETIILSISTDEANADTSFIGVNQKVIIEVTEIDEKPVDSPEPTKPSKTSETKSHNFEVPVVITKIVKEWEELPLSQKIVVGTATTVTVPVAGWVGFKSIEWLLFIFRKFIKLP